MTLRIPAKVLLHVWSYGFYDMTLSTGKQRLHMIIYLYYTCIKSIEHHDLSYNNGDEDGTLLSNVTLTITLPPLHLY